VVIVGGGNGGIGVAARLLRAGRDLDVAIIEPSETHYYEPLWTLVGGGVVPKEKSARPQADVIPRGAAWVRSAVTQFVPEANQVLTEAESGSSTSSLSSQRASSSTGTRSSGCAAT
jgi:sulfide:quinone oxidoreductase